MHSFTRVAFTSDAQVSAEHNAVLWETAPEVQRVKAVKHTHQIRLDHHFFAFRMSRFLFR